MTAEKQLIGHILIVAVSTQMTFKDHLTSLAVSQIHRSYNTQLMLQCL